MAEKIVIIGAGPGGYVAALEAAQAGRGCHSWWKRPMPGVPASTGDAFRLRS